MQQIRRARPLLGTLAQVSVQGEGSVSDLHAAVDAAFDAITTVQGLMSFHAADSELSRLNREALSSVQPIDPHTRRVLEAALHVACLSDGAFDPCVADALCDRGLLPVPRWAATAVSGRSSWRDIELTARGVRFHRPLWLDLGGIAKGYAVDLALEQLARLGVCAAVVNAGGDLRVSGPHPHGVAIRHPGFVHVLGHEIQLRNEALATSCAFQSRVEASPSALVNPATRAGYSGDDSVSVRAGSCMIADALTKVALFAPRQRAEQVFEACQAFCIRISPDPSS